MAYPQNISDTSYNHLTTPFDVRCRDLYVDRNFFGPSNDQGFSVQYNNLLVISELTETLVPFDTVDPTEGQYNPSNIFNIGTSTATIAVTGTYIINASVNYEHNFFASPTGERVSVSVRLNGPAGDNLIESIYFYPPALNDTITVSGANILRLTAGDTLQVYFATILTSPGDQIITNANFSCQRIA